MASRTLASPLAPKAGLALSAPPAVSPWTATRWCRTRPTWCGNRSGPMRFISTATAAIPTISWNACGLAKRPSAMPISPIGRPARYCWVGWPNSWAALSGGTPRPNNSPATRRPIACSPSPSARRGTREYKVRQMKRVSAMHKAVNRLSPGLSHLGMLIPISLLLALVLLFPGLQPSLRGAETNEQQLMQLLQSNASPMEKDSACAQLKRIGTDESVPALAALLDRKSVVE